MENNKVQMSDTVRQARSAFSSQNGRDLLKSIHQGTHQYRWKGIPCLKNPFDFANYWRLIWEKRPQTIIELGSFGGGSALWLADILTCCQIDGRVISVDIEPVTTIRDDRITFLKGDVSDLGAVFSDSHLAQWPRPWLVIEDSSHQYEHCLAAMTFFHPHMKRGEYMLIEDGIVSDLGEADHFNGGPNRAIAEFLHTHRQEYFLDVDYCDFFGHNVTWNTNGYLCRL